MKKTLLAALLVFIFAPVHNALATTNKPTQSALQKIINGKHRSAENKHRDKFRHPEQTLNFFDVKEDMTVVEVWPGKGWYTEILAPYLRDKGKLYAAHFSPHNQDAYFRDSLKNYHDLLHRFPALYDKVEVTVLQPNKDVIIAPDESADRVLTFRNIHNWMNNDQATTVFNALFKALKPGGILGIVEHRGSSIKAQDPKATTGYVSEDYVITLARKAGFEFLAKSEINANSKDTKDYAEGVWTLPPTLKLKEKDKEKYLAIGESDRMTIKFMKPKKKTIASFLPSELFGEFERADLTKIPTAIQK